MSAFALSASRAFRQNGFKSLRTASSARTLSTSAQSVLRQTSRTPTSVTVSAQRYLQTHSGATNVKVGTSPLESVPSGAEGKGAVPSAVDGKLWPSAEEAIKELKGGITVLSAGEFIP